MKKDSKNISISQMIDEIEKFKRNKTIFCAFDCEGCEYIEECYYDIQGEEPKTDE